MISRFLSTCSNGTAVITGLVLVLFWAFGSADIAPRNLFLHYAFAPHDIWCGRHHSPAIAEANQAASQSHPTCLFKPSVSRSSRITTMATIARPEYDIIFAGGKLGTICLVAAQSTSRWCDGVHRGWTPCRCGFHFENPCAYQGNGRINGLHAHPFAI